MSKKLRSIIWGVGLLVVLSAVLLVLKLSTPDEDITGDGSSDLSSTFSNEIYLSDKLTDEVERVIINNPSDSYILERDSGGTWMIEELAGLPTDDLVLNSLADYSGRIVVTGTVEENAEDLAKYGLSEPDAEATAEFNDGTSVTVQIGDEAPLGMGYYIKLKDNNTVYTLGTTATKKFLAKKADFLSLTIMEAYSGETENNFPEEVRIERADLPEPVVLNRIEADSKESLLYNNTGMIMTSPMYSCVTVADLDTYIIAAYNDGLKALGAVAFNYSDEEAAEYGFSEASPKAVFVIDGETTTITVGNEILDEDGNSSGNYYVRSEELPIIFSVAKSSIPWIEFSYKDVVSDLIITPSIDFVEKIELIAGEKTYNIELSENTDDLKVKIDGNNITTEYFKNFYKLLIAAPVEDIDYSTAESGTPDIEIKFYYNDDRFETDILTFYPAENRKALAYLNGESCFIIRNQYLEHLKAQTEKIINDQDVTTDY